jgi:hypothetical protein
MGILAPISVIDSANINKLGPLLATEWITRTPNGILLARGEILLAFGLVFFRPSSACTMMEGRESDFTMFCSGSIYIRHARRKV